MPSELSPATLPAWSAWLRAARLRTLPLAVASILCGSLVAMINGGFQWQILILCLLTALGLQIFSNFANDYGDAQNGADALRVAGSQARMVSSGQISVQAMQRGLVITASMCCVLGLLLLKQALAHSAGMGVWLLWLALGALSLTAAFCYTAGHKPYGYAGLGDVAVLIFFGWLGVLGTAFLHTGVFNYWAILPASALGLWCVMVLNLNNMRDINGDLKAGKHTIAARLGLAGAKRYHLSLLWLGGILWLWWLMEVSDGILWQLIILCILMVWHSIVIKPTIHAPNFDKLLPQWSLSVLAWVAWLVVSL